MEGNLWKVILCITLPIIFYSVFQFIFNFCDFCDIVFNSKNITTKNNSFIISSINRIHLLKEIFAALGSSIATAGVILVGRSYGHKNFEKMRLYLSQTFLLTVIIDLIVTILCTIVFQKPILKHIYSNSKNYKYIYTGSN